MWFVSMLGLKLNHASKRGPGTQSMGQVGRLPVRWHLCYLFEFLTVIIFRETTHSFPDSKFHKANMGPIWGRQDPDGPHVGPLNVAMWVTSYSARAKYNTISEIIRSASTSQQGYISATQERHCQFMKGAIKSKHATSAARSCLK